MEKKTQNRTVWSIGNGRREKSERRANFAGSHAGRLLRMEPLEQRELLAVSLAEYNQIRELYSGFDLAADWQQVQVVDLEELSREALLEAVSSATSTQGDDLIVVRTLSCTSSIDLGDDTLTIDYDAARFGTLTIVGWGDTLLELSGRATLVNVVAGDVQLGAMKLTLQGTATDSDFEFLASDAQASLSTSRMLFVRDSQVSCSVEESTEAGSGLFSAATATQSGSTGYYSVEFQLTRTDNNPTETKWAYVTGLDSSGVDRISTSLGGGYGSTDPLSVIGETSGYFIDAEKSNAVLDGDLCWAATASNMLWYSGWANSSMTPAFSSEDSVLDYFKTYWPNMGGNIGTANDWFFNGGYGIDGGGLYQDVSYGSLGGSMSITGGMKFANMVERLRADDAIGLSVGWFSEGPGETLTTRYGGHAITLWGYVYDKAYAAGTTDYYCACIIADSDNNKYAGTSAPNVLCSCDILWDDTNSGYYFKSYKSAGSYGWLETFYWLSPNTPLAHKPQLARTTISLSTTTLTTSATVACQISQIVNAATYTLEYSKTAAFAADETVSCSFTYEQTDQGIYSVNGLDPGTLYYFRVKCVGNGVDYRDSEWSATKSITTETAKTQLAVPQLTADVCSDHSVTISLTTVANASGYTVWFSTDQSDFSKASAYTFSQAGTHSLYGLKAGTTWYFRAAALGDGQFYSDSQPSAVVSKSTTGTASSDDYSKGNIVTTLLDIVDSSDGLISLREAISYCGNYGTSSNITFAENLRGGTITLSALNNLSTKTTSLLITKSLTITGLIGEGEDTSPAITINGNKTNKVFYFFNTVSNGTQQTNAISNLVVTGGALKIDHDGNVHGGGGIEVLRTALTLNNCVVTGNVLESSGSGTDSASAQGAGIYARDSQLTVQNSIISDNAINISSTKAAYLYGAGIVSTGNAANSESYPASLTLVGSMLEENTMTARSTQASCFVFGAAVSNTGSSVLSITDCELSSNHVTVNMENTVSVSVIQLSANVRGGAVYNDSTAENRIDRTIIRNNIASVQAVSDSKQVVAGVYGTGIHNAGVLVVSNTLMAGNNARAQAASENENEFAQVYGTALYVAGGGTLDLIGSTLSGNEASVAALDSETVSGTLYIDCSSQSEIITVVNVYNSIIARNVATQGGDIALDDGATVYGANNLADFSGWDAASTNNIVFQANDELFVDADEGDYHLSPTSAAALKADPGYVFIRTSAVSWDALTDLDGNARVAGSGIDMGAYELAIVSEEYSMIEASPSLLITPVSDTQLKVEIIAVDRVQYYTVLYRASGETQWQTGCSTQSLQFSLDELEPDTQYEFMAVGVQESTDSTHTRVSQLYTGATPATGTQESPSLVVTTLLDIEDAYDNEISLREAVKYLSAVSGTNKTITFDTSLAGKTIELKHGVITIEESVVLDASNLNNHVVISGGGSSSILSIPTTTAEVTLKNLAFIDGYSDAVDGGAILSYCSSLTVIDCLFQDNKVAYSSATGGGAIASYGWTLVVESSGFYRNTVATASDSAAGGAIWCYGGGEITDCVFVQNSLINSVSNYVVGGGAIGTQSQMTVAASVFVENTAASGGAILAFATLTVTDSIFEGNSATIYGGGICMYQATASVSGTSFVDNHAQYGGGFCGYGNILKSVFQENVAEYGGGIHLSSSTTVRSVVTECLITGNRSQSAATYAWGGGVSVMGAATITNCTITKNVAGLAGERTGYGGGLGCLSASAAIVQNCIIVDNTTVDADGLYHVSDVSVSSTASYPIGKNVLTGSASVWNSTDSVNIIGYSQTSPLFVNAEAGDYSLVRSASSQALDAGDNSFVTTERTTDLAGATRIYGTKVDLGAYEVQAMTRQAVCAFVINDAATTDNSVTIDLSDSTGTGTGSQSYLVQCSNSPNFDTTVFSQTVVGTGLYEITGLEAAKDYFIRVRTVASGTGDASIWTSVQAWTTNARILATPVLETPVKAEDAVEFSWSAVEGATSYLIEYSQDETFTGVTRQILYDNAGSYRIDHVTPLGVWYFRVSALGMGTCSDSLPSEVKSVALLGMTLKYTLDSSSFTSRSTENEITIATFTVTGSSSYNYVLISTGSEILPLKVVNDKLVTNGTMTPGDYSIRVRAESSDETNVSNEVVVAFTVLTTPPDNITLSASQGLPNREAGLTIGILSATMYDANTPYWFTLVQTGDAAYFAMDTTTNTLKTAGALAASTTYQVTVRAQNAGGAFEKTFSIVTIAAPVAVPDHEEYTVAAGCQVQLSGTGTDESGRVITEYYWDTNGDGIADQTGQSIWVDSMSLNPDVQSRMATVDFWVRNDLDAQSVKQSISVTVDRITPLARVTPTVRVLDDDEGRIFVARVDMSVVGRENIRRWQFSWGDDSNGTDIAVITSSMCCAHYFASPGSYEVKLTITLTDGSSDVFSLGQFVFESPDVVLQASSAVVDESPLMVVDEPEVAIDSSQEQTAFDSALVAVTDEWHSCVVSERVLIDLASSEHWKKKRLSL